MTLTDTTAVATGPVLDGLEVDDVPAARRLWDRHFPPTEPREELLERAAASDEPAYMGVVARDRGEVIGVGLQTYGEGRDLARARIRAAAARGCERVIGCAWGHGAEMLQSLGFERLGTIEEYYDHEPGAVTVYRRWL